METGYQEVLKFWFQEIKPEKWFTKDLEFDQLLRDRFGKLFQQASQGELPPPQRNEILGRASTPEEIEFLKTSKVRF